MNTTSICKRCHRLRAVDRTRTCAQCVADLRALERPVRRRFRLADGVAGDTLRPPTADPSFSPASLASAFLDSE